ncbi:MAG: M16 family metallopeptidase [Candidatus Aminicenantales bacterium]
MDKKICNFKRIEKMKAQRMILKIFGVLFILSILTMVPVLAQKSPKEKFVFGPLHPIKMPKVEKVRLANGLQLFLVEDHEYPTIDLRALVHTGSVFEPSSKIGLASVTGQVLRTGGTESMTGDEIDKEVEKLAVSISTSIGQTSGYVTLSGLKQDMDRALDILADILLHPAFREDKIQLAKMQQKTAISRRNDDVGQITYREFRKLIYGPSSPYARQSEYATIEAISREDIVNFYNQYFHPNNTLMTVWGDFKTAEMVAKIKKRFGLWPKIEVKKQPLPRVRYKYKYTVNFINKADVNQSNIMIGHIGGLMNNPDYPALLVMNSILSFDRMFKKIRTAEGLAYSVWGAYGAGYVFPGVFSSGAQTKSESTVYAIQLMLHEIKRITETEVSDEELAKAKDEYLNSYVFNFDSRAKIVNRMMTYAFYGYPLNFMERVKKGVEKVTKADVLRVARKYLHPDKVQILVVGNKDKFDKPLTTLGEVRTIDITLPPPKEK